MRRDTKKHKARQSQFYAEMTALLQRKGVKPGEFYDHQLDTPIGLLHIMVQDSWVATRFDVPKAATIFTGRDSNPYSGKWNHHYSEDAPVDECVADLERRLDKLLAYQPDEECRQLVAAGSVEKEQRAQQFAIWRAELDKEKQPKA